MRKSSKFLAILFLLVAGGLVFFVTKKDEAEILAAVEAQVVDATAVREQQLADDFAARERALADTLTVREQAVRDRLAALDAARENVDTPVYYRITADVAEGVLRRLGLAYERSLDDQGDPQFTFALATYNTTLFFYGCEEEGCASLRLYAHFSMDTAPSLETINDWNNRKRFTQAYINSSGNAALDSDLVVQGGVALGAVETFVLTFRDLLSEFATHIGF